jgi:hypothetical protein
VGGYATPGVFAARVRNRLKIKKIAKTATARVRKCIERKKLGSFSGKQKGSVMAEGLEEATTLTQTYPTRSNMYFQVQFS